MRFVSKIQCASRRVRGSEPPLATTKIPFVLKHGLFPVALLALSQGLLAQQLPGAGSQIQQLPPTQMPQKVAPEIRIQEGTAIRSPHPGGTGRGRQHPNGR